MHEGTAFVEGLRSKARLLAPAAAATVREHDELASWVLDPLARWTRAAYGEQAFADAALGYKQYCSHVLEAQATYEETGCYNPRTMTEIVDHVYGSDGYMVPYMWAAILIYPFWPSMIRHVAMFRDRFVHALKPDAEVLELACGHGVMGLLALEDRKDVRVVGQDIAPASIAIAKRLAAASGHEARNDLSVGDALAWESAGAPGRYRGVIAAMLAEHLPEPQRLLRTVAHHLAPDGIAYFSTALESAQCDHVYEFHRESEVIAMIEQAGLRVVELVCDGADPRPGSRYRPRALATILRHA